MRVPPDGEALIEESRKRGTPKEPPEKIGATGWEMNTER
jgi:hypothetical protein